MSEKKSDMRTPYGVRFTDAEVEAIDRAAERVGWTRHAFVRRAALWLAGVADVPEPALQLFRDVLREKMRRRKT